MKDFVLFISILFLFVHCSKEEQPLALCSSENAVSFFSDLCLVIEDSKFNPHQREMIVQQTSEALSSIRQFLPLNNIVIRIIDNPNLITPSIGLGGYNPSRNEIQIAIQEDSSQLATILENYYQYILAHEIHHTIRRRSVGYGNTLFKALITEGLADHFALEITRQDPLPWSLAIQGDALEDLMEAAQSHWHSSDYNHREWFLGTNPNIPLWAGYSMGYALVKSYLNSNPTTSAASLHNKPAEAFLSK